jgi:hypothetical protein
VQVGAFGEKTKPKKHFETRTQKKNEIGKKQRKVQIRRRRRRRRRRRMRE